MDPNENIKRQRELANRILDPQLDETDDVSDEERRDNEDRAEELAYLVLALDDWRRKGGFDPYSATPPIASMRAIVDYDWATEQRDYEECEQNGNEREGHVFEHLQVVDKYLTGLETP